MNGTQSSRQAGTQLNRRHFLAGTAGAAAAFTIMSPERVRGSEANSRIKLGLIGCGGRGQWIANLFKQHGGYQLTAGADYFQDRVDQFGEKLGVEPKHRHTSLSGYRALLEDDVDAVAIISPPYFHPEQATAAVEAGKHVYLAKPIAVDPHGCRVVEKAGQRARERQRVFLVDFQTRANELYKEAIRRVHDGELGTLAFGEAMYHANRLGIKTEPDGSPEARLRNWMFYKDLSGDIITEQNIHTLDVMSWIMDATPLAASGTGGRKVRTDVGDCWDNFQLVYTYPDSVGMTFSSRQFDGHGAPYAGIRNRVFGSKASLATEYGGAVALRGVDNPVRGLTTDIYQQGAVNNIATFHESVANGRYDNETVPPSVRSNLITILGRTAAYEGREVKWDEIAGSDTKIEADLSGLKQ